MSNAAAFQATVHGFRTVPTRKVVQITIEAPIEQHSTIAAIAEHGAWVAVARLVDQPKQEAPARKEYTLPQRVAMVCQEPAFQAFVYEQYPHWSGQPVADFVRYYCGVQSRSEILPDTEAARLWDKLHAEYLLWSRS